MKLARLRARTKTAKKRRPWYLAGGVPLTNVDAVYQPVGAVSYAASKINLANPGVHNAFEGVAPDWNTIDGWIGDGSKYLRTDITPDSNKTLIVKYTDWTGGWAVCGGEFWNPVQRFNISYAGSQWGQQEGGAHTSSGFFTLSKTAYSNKTLVKTYSEVTFSINYPFALLGRNNSGSFDKTTVKVQAIAIYNIRLTQAQIFAIIDGYNTNFANGTPMVTVDSSAILRSDASSWYGRPVCEVVNNIVVMVYKHASSHSVNDGELHVKFSDDYGVSWSDEDIYIDGSNVTNFPMNPPDLGVGEDSQEPWLMVAPNGDLLLHMWKDDYGVTQHGTWQSRSTDNGRSWSIPIQILPSGLASPDQLFATDDHFVYNEVIYVGARFFNSNWSGCKCLLIKSVDNGITWEFVSDITGFTTATYEVAIEYLGNNTIIALLRGSGNVAYKSISNDMGLTWSATSDVSVLLGNGGRHRIFTGKHLRGESNWWTDKTLIVSGFNDGRYPIIWISKDAGASWYKFSLDSASTDNGYGDMFYNPNTRKYVYLGYYGSQGTADIKQYNLTISGI